MPATLTGPTGMPPSEPLMVAAMVSLETRTVAVLVPSVTVKLSVLNCPESRKATHSSLTNTLSRFSAVLLPSAKSVVSTATGVGAVTNTGKVEPGSTVAVIGTGGVGLNVIQGAQLAGARQIIAVDLLEHKLAYARKFGATDTVDASGGDAVQQVLDISGGGVDYAFEAIGLGETARQAFDMTRRGGTAVIVGMIAPGIDIPIPGLAMLSEKKLIGSFYGSSRIHKDMPHILELAQSGKIDLEGLITKRYDKLEDVNIGFDALRNGEVARSVIEVSAE